MMFYKVVLTFLVIAALSVNVLAAPTSLRARAQGEDRELQQLKQLMAQIRQQREQQQREQQQREQQQRVRELARQMALMVRVQQERLKYLPPGQPKQPPPPEGQ